jgi:Fibronectin type III domain
MHEGIVGGIGQYEIGTFLMIDDTLPSGVTLNYVPSPVTDNVCSSLKTYATATGMVSTSLGGSGTKIVPSSGGASATPTVTINIDGNGGRCTTPSVTGYLGTWATAPGGTDCRRSGFIFNGFNTAADGSGIAIAPGGNLNLTTDNTLYAQYSQTRLSNAPSNVVATPGLKKVTVRWQAPSDLGTGPINAYLVQASPGSSSCVTNLASANMLECVYTNLSPGTNYTFAVQALNQAGWSNFSAASNSASPYDLKLDVLSRPEVKFLFFKRGSNLEAEGRAPGLKAGAVLTPVLQLGADGAFVPLTKDTAKVDKDGNFTWSRKLDKNDNGKPASLYFTYGNDKTATLTAKLGATIGLPSAPRDVKVKSDTAGFTVSWQPPARDGGSPISEYQMTSDVRAPSWAQSRFVSCTVKAPATSCTMQGSTTVFDPNKTYTFSVVAKTERGTSRPATQKWKGEIYRLNIFKRARIDSEILLSFSAFGWAKDARGFEIQAKVGENGTWKKQGTASLDPDYVEPIGDWIGMLPKSVTGGSEVFYRVKSDRGFSDVVRFRLSSSFEYSFG